jgi:hypothetical protein
MGAVRWFRRKNGEDGQALVEFALVAPVLVLLILGIVDFARAWNVYEILTDAAREGARVVVVANDIGPDEAVPIIQSAGALGRVALEAGDIQITQTMISPNDPGWTVRIEHDYEFRWVGPLMGLLTGDRTITLVTQFTMRDEGS